MSRHFPSSPIPAKAEHDHIMPGNALRPATMTRSGTGEVLRRHVPRAARWFGTVVAPVVAALVLLLALWQWYASGPGGNSLVLPTPISIWATLIRQRAALWDNSLVTLQETAAGFGVALVAGMAFGRRGSSRGVGVS